MSRKYHKQKVLQTKPITYRRIYSKRLGEDVKAVIFGLIFLGAGMMVFFSPHDSSPNLLIFIGLLAFFGIFVIVGALFGTLQSVIIDGEKLIVAYRLTDNIYKASDVKTINWQTGLYSQKPAVYINISYRQRFPGDLGPSGDLYGQYGRYSFLSVQMKNGKKVQIPGSPYGRVDMQKILVAWQEKYTNPASEID